MDPTSLTEAGEFLHTFAIQEDDLKRVRAMGEAVLPRLDEAMDRFYQWLPSLPEYEGLFARPSALRNAREAQAAYWRSFFSGVVDAAYLAERVCAGETHARIGLPLSSYFAGVNYAFTLFCGYLKSGSRETASQTLLSTAKLLHMDTALVVETYSRLLHERVLEQSRAMMEMSTPVSMIWQDILLLPIVGIIDSQRSQGIMEGILSKISTTRARVFIMDISGVAVVDSAVANHLIKITKATQLMGCESLVSGLSPAIAQTIVHLGIDTEQISTFATLRDALEEAFRNCGLAIRQLG
ncbi:Anti-anti-sigma regulatory factor (antagonist of anti-sigma factor) [Chromobacterium violaceum]|uniref:Anti-anti-sigma factor n=1 Tax=Chromobacterium violaceum TaxID=536 RepID=A0A202BAI8_CHRVL|nr:protoglobin domain-containing protein [Chromobacterium violaceum]KJH65936.1 anti-anti-sigma regulatory factor [Chromobacterium violaceum]KMN50590.1 anti-anti-sigma regulatory factor [Chromobacterium violaceum]KMN87085.1 anti-anti-sigma regulatory factor [Chromobacterium violaceum]KMN89790.1 anti-anti-sigma regulatory factor [Chromobacterium violaceum]KMO03834.1 anti-anti-sigma regulatory factor [Chromobacterium violaceum]